MTSVYVWNEKTMLAVHRNVLKPTPTSYQFLRKHREIQFCAVYTMLLALDNFIYRFTIHCSFNTVWTIRFFFENLFQSSWKIETKIEILIFCLIILHFKFSESSQIFSSKSFTKSWSFMISYFSVVTESGCESFLWLSKCIAADLEWYMLLFLLNFWANS